MDENQTSDPTLTTNPAKLAAQLVAAVILAEGVWGLLSSLTRNLLVPLLAGVMNADPGSPTYLGKGEVNVSFDPRGSWLITAAPALLTTSSWESVPPEQPIAPMIAPCSMSGMPPHDAMIPSKASR